jgi:multidrug/hemolysin transport system permease protein
MSNIYLFTVRGIKLFLRDKAAVFFSFLSTLILVALYFLFIGKSYAEGVSEAVGAMLSSDAVFALVYIQMIAGVLVLNSLSLSVGAFLTIARDFESRRIDSFLLTPLKSSHLLLAYFCGAFLISFGLNLLTWGLSVTLIGICFGSWVSAGTLLTVAGILLFASFVSCSLMLLFTAIVKSSAAIGVFSGVAGTFLGFVCGIYMPYTTLGNGIATVGSVLPFTHTTIWLKQVVLGDAFRTLGSTDLFKTAMLENFSANNLGFVGLDIPLGGMLVYTAVFAALCLGCAGLIISRRLT